MPLCSPEKKPIAHWEARFRARCGVRCLVAIPMPSPRQLRILACGEPQPAQSACRVRPSIALWIGSTITARDCRFRYQAAAGLTRHKRCHQDRREALTRTPTRARGPTCLLPAVSVAIPTRHLPSVRQHGTFPQTGSGKLDRTGKTGKDKKSFRKYEHFFFEHFSPQRGYSKSRRQLTQDPLSKTAHAEGNNRTPLTDYGVS